MLEQLLDFREAVVDEIAHRDEAGLQPVVGDGEDRALRLVENQLRLLIAFVGIRQDLVRRVDQIPQRRLFLDDARVVLDVGRLRHAVDERRHVGRPAHIVQLAATRELLFQRDEVDRRAALAERDHPIEDAPVRVAVEVAAVDHLRRGVEGVVVDEDRAEDRAFGFQIVRKRTFDCCDRLGHLIVRWGNANAGRPARYEPFRNQVRCGHLPELRCAG